MAATVQRPTRWYTSREEVKNFISSDLDASITAKDSKIDRLIAAASRYIENYTDRLFIPWTGTKEFDYQGVSQLILGDDLLSVTSLSKDGTAISASNYFLYPLNALDKNKPYLWIELLFTSDLFQFTDTRQSAIAIAGKWGYSELTRLLTTINEGEEFAADDVTLTVTDGANADIGQTLLIESEQLWVSNVSTNDLTVSRAQNGTTAAAHADGTAVYVIEPVDDIKLACQVLVARNLQRADAAWSDRIGTPQQGYTYIKSVPAEVKDILEYYKRRVHKPTRPMGRFARVGRYPLPGDDGNWD